MLREHIGSSADVFYHFVEKPFAPSSLTVTVSGRFVCEAFPAQKLPFTGADPAELQAHMDGNRQHEKELKETITRINHSAAAILPPEASASTVSEKAQLRDHCYAASVMEQASTPSDSAPPLPDGRKISREPTPVPKPPPRQPSRNSLTVDEMEYSFLKPPYMNFDDQLRTKRKLREAYTQHEFLLLYGYSGCGKATVLTQFHERFPDYIHLITDFTSLP